MLHDHNRLILSGPSGTGKTYLANKLASFLLSSSASGSSSRLAASSSSATVATFTVGLNNVSALKDFLARATTSNSETSAPPRVVILDNLHRVTSKLDDVFEVCGHNPDQFIVGTFDDDDNGASSAQATAATSPTSSVVGSYNFR